MPSNQDLYSVFMLDDNNLYIGSNIMLKSNNGGSTWSQVNITSGGLPVVGNLIQDLHFSDANTGVMAGFFVLGGSQYIFRTESGGNDWTEVFTANIGGQPRGFNDLSFINNSTGWAVGTGGAIVKTTNGGATWTQQFSSAQEDLFSVHFLDANIGFIAGDGTFLKTTNGGATWNTTSHNAAFSEVFFTSQNVGFIAGWDFLWRTTDGGQTWQDLQFPNGNSFIRDIHFISPDTGYVLSQRQLFKTTDGGNIWEYQQLLGASNTLHLLEGFDWLNANKAIIVGNNGWCRMTANAGGNYYPIVGFEVEGNPQKLCAGQDYQLVNLTGAAPNYTYEWQLEGVTFSTEANPIINLPNLNTYYDVKLTVSNGVLSSSVTMELSTLGNVSLYMPELNGNPIITTCQGNQVTITSPSLPQFYFNNPITYKFLANGVEVPANGSNNSIYYSTSITDTTLFQLVGMAVTPCGDTVMTVKQKLVNAAALPTSIDITADALFICDDETTVIHINNSVPGVSYNFHGVGTQFGNGGPLSFTSPPINVTVTVKNGSFCQRTLNNLLEITGVKINAGVGNWYGATFVGDTVTFAYYLDPLYNYHWEFGPSAMPPASTESTQQVVYQEAGTFPVQLSISHAVAGCPDTAQSLVHVFPAAQLELPTEVCYDVNTGLVFTNLSGDLTYKILDVTVGADGYTYATGYWTRTYPFPGLFNLVLFKFDPDGNLVWEKKTSHNDHGSNVGFRHFVGTTVTADAWEISI
ncbi:MAG: hypothetical protein IPN76_18845 [Saprospiraceae bacterium]|nr:hypothetical protein [Saprospiraceae bacterium]